MRNRGRWFLLAALMTVMAVIAGGATAVAFQTRDRGGVVESPDAANPEQNPVQYSVKFVCGFSHTEEFNNGVKPGNYATAVNIHNHTTNGVNGGVRVALHYNLSEAVPPLQPAVPFTVALRRVREVDCSDIWAMVGVPPETYLKGMLHIGLSQPLSVWAVYTAQTDIDPTPELPPDPGAGISIDVEQVFPIQAPLG